MTKLIPEFVSKLFKKEKPFSDEEVIALNKKRNLLNTGDISRISLREMKYMKGEDQIKARYIKKHFPISQTMEWIGGEYTLRPPIPFLLKKEFLTEQEVLELTSLTSKRRKTLEAAKEFPMRLTVRGGDVIYGHCYFGEDIRKWYERKLSNKRKPREKG